MEADQNHVVVDKDTTDKQVKGLKGLKAGLRVARCHKQTNKQVSHAHCTLAWAAFF